MGKKNSSAVDGKARAVGKQSFFDYNLLAVVIILICFGLVMLYSASSMGFFLRQSLYFVGAITGALIVSMVDYHILVRLSVPIYLSAFVLMLLVPFIGMTLNGAKRWLKLGPLSFQPSEVAKIAVILIMANIIVSLGRHIGWIRSFIYMLFVVALQSAAALFFTDNLSTALIIAGIGVLLIFVYHPKTIEFIIAFLVLMIVVIVFLTYLKYSFDSPDTGNTNFRLVRIRTWFAPEKYLNEGGYQVMQGLYAIGSGGLFGKGLGNSSQKLSRIPEAMNDMIFSIICEELGLFGALLLMILFGYLLYRLFWIAQNAPDLHGSIIASGVMLHIALQIVLNISVVLNVIPTTGVSLPFVSYGGTAVVFLMGEIGICLNISRQIRVKT